MLEFTMEKHVLKVTFLVERRHLCSEHAG
ncbi:hypothetical protein E2C01_045432 [Portunus trituberculatus]|uniref:Uncharacterized protein n=1 Tax=Portunus trituberculatus TaxID=210409 RepID=A0A5B7G519_PORTR|nr:hypothetical protein [Portunus trituberculatus]